MKIYNFYLKPTRLVGWKIIRETEKCLVIEKERGTYYKFPSYMYLPKKNIIRKEIKRRPKNDTKRYKTRD